MPFATQPSPPPVDETAADTGTLVGMGVVEEQPVPTEEPPPEPVPEEETP